MNAQHLFLFIIFTVTCEEEFKIRIGLPEYICDKDGGIKDISNGMTTIRLLGKNSQDVDCKFEVNFRTIGKKCHNNQRCTLRNWRAVRELNSYLQSYPLVKLQSGLIEINNTLLIPGLKYILHVKILSAGNTIDEKTLTLDYINDNVKKNITKPMVSLVLTAPDTCYAYTAYVINAKVNICSNFSTYYFNWEFSAESDTETVTELPSRSSELVVVSETFQASRSYTIWCGLVNLADGALVAKTRHNLKVLSKGLILRLFVKHLTVKTGQAVKIRALIRDLDNTQGEIKVSWLCQETTSNETCDYQSDTNEFDVDPGFTEPGLYNVSISVVKNNFTESDWCTIAVTDDDIPVVEFEEIEFPINPLKGVEIQATVYELKTFCTVQWTSPQVDGYEFLDLDAVPGNIAESINVTIKEDLFLNELEEFSNGTVDKKYSLVIPPPSDEWEALKGDTKYLFRLIILCPIMDVNETVSTSTNDIFIETQAPPKMQQLEVTPVEGEAFLTTFIFKTMKAEGGDGSVLYKFGYTLDNRDVILWTLGGVTSCETSLPYCDDGIQTFVEGCDSFNSCQRVLGPLIRTKFPKNVDDELILQKFINKMTGGDYGKAFIEAFAILESYKSRDDNTTREIIIQKIDESIDKYLKMEDLDDAKIKYSADDLMRNINSYNSHLQLPETVLNKVLDLRNKFTDEPEAEYTQRKLLSFRPKRAAMTLYDARSYLEISELIITSTNDPNKIKYEKEKLRKQLRNYMEKLCANMKKNQLTLELKTVVFSIEKLTKSSLNNFISIPFEGNSWQTSARIKLGNVVKDTKQKCIGKAIFKDYLDKVGVIYFADILNGSVNEPADITVYLPKNIHAEGAPNCIVYRNDAWNSDCKVIQNIANFVKCSCKYLGYYYCSLEYKEAVSTVSPSYKVTTVSPTEKSFNQTLGKFINDNNTKTNYDTISYIVIVVSVIGIIILIITIRRVFHDDDDEEEAETFDFPKYAQLHDEEFLNDVHM